MLYWHKTDSYLFGDFALAPGKVLVLLKYEILGGTGLLYCVCFVIAKFFAKNSMMFTLMCLRGRWEIVWKKHCSENREVLYPFLRNKLVQLLSREVVDAPSLEVFKANWMGL